jgi:FkbM family methyltransferase
MNNILKKELSDNTIINFKPGMSRVDDEFMKATKPNHVWEPQTTKLLVYLSRDAKNVIIGGAYIGDQAIIIAKKNKVCCHAFEPSTEAFKILKLNIKDNNLKNITPIKAGLWDKDNIKLKLMKDYGVSSVIDEAEVSEKIETITVDSYLKRNNLKQVELIMLDVEGAELKALKGAENQLGLPKEEAPNIIFEIHRKHINWDKGLNNTKIIKYLKSFGYHVFAIRDFHSNYNMRNKPIELIPPERTYLEGPPHGFNMLAIKDLPIIKNENFKICHDVSPKLFLHKKSKYFQPT